MKNTHYKLQNTNHKQILMNETPNSKRYDLEERTAVFAENCRNFTKKLQKNIHNLEYGKQLVRSFGSQAANYIETSEGLSKKDFIYRMKICRKETKESCLWLRLYDTNNNQELEKERKSLFDEAMQLRKIFTSIISKSGI